ncbi:MAG: alanine dehydrogenase [Bacteroidetes bacterium]|nr:alanine dehydrogenase [Bacteroidota bacterium]MBT6688088.1 alanine dehydrogenase [Bacteroidota bacterium]MBT7144521.1 alanine dehydrogenase [Bacteroidota bacterium]MBT7490340.1 alanine dehydrogenase [Bacteroidota bacterium]
MKEKFKIGVLKETKNPPDKRVVLPPKQAVELLKKYPKFELIIQPSELRCYDDKEYSDLGLTLSDDLSQCDLLAGVKEVDIPALIPNKQYLFFSHTAKKQPYNRKLLQEIIAKKITLLDHEYLTDKNNFRLVAFGRWAGIVGAYNGLVAYGLRSGLFKMKRAHECYDMDDFFAELNKVKLPAIKILITGGGRVAQGAMETIEPLNLKKVTPQDFLSKTYDEAVFCQIDPWNYTKRKNGEPFDLEHFFRNPSEYESTFLPYTKVTDMFIACHFWDEKSPVFMTKDDMRADDFKIGVIADVSCDIDGPIPSTIRSSTIAEPFYGYNTFSEKEDDPFNKKNICVMAVDNLPGEAPRNASVDFSEGLIEKVFPAFINGDIEGIADRATIVKNGELAEKYSYLSDFAAGKE